MEYLLWGVFALAACVLIFYIGAAIYEMNEDVSIQKKSKKSSKKNKKNRNDDDDNDNDFFGGAAYGDAMNTGMYGGIDGDILTPL